jgi:glycosyltransferase involved in cell wall biosynthesis
MDYSGVKPTLTFVLTTFNQESLINRVIHSIVNYSSLPSQLIVIDDKSEDETLGQILKMVGDENWENGNLSKISVYGNKESRFETFCDDFGIRSANTEYVVLVQSDVIITEHEFDAKLIACLEHFPDILMVSARGTEPIAPIADFFRKSNGSVISLGRLTLFMTKRHIRKSMHGFISGLCVLSFNFESKFSELRKKVVRISRVFSKDNEALDFDVERPPSADFIRLGKAGYLSEYDVTRESGFEKVATVWLGQTVMRGPIALNRSNYLDAGGFDLSSTFLGFDDHEIALRAYLKFKYRVGFMPIGYKSLLEWGNTRRPRSLKQSKAAIHNCLRISDNRKLTSLYNISDTKASSLPTPEIREFLL